MPFLFMLRVALVATDEGEGLGEFLPAAHLARCWCPVGDTERGVGTVWGEASLWKGDHETRCTGSAEVRLVQELTRFQTTARQPRFTGGKYQ